MGRCYLSLLMLIVALHPASSFASPMVESGVEAAQPALYIHPASSFSSPMVEAAPGRAWGEHVDQQERTSEGPEARGVKGKAVRDATLLLASAIRLGGEKAARILHWLDDKAARSFRKYAGKIADQLDRIAKIPDLTTEIVKEKVFNFLRIELNVSGGTAMEIADAIKEVIDIML